MSAVRRRSWNICAHRETGKEEGERAGVSVGGARHDLSPVTLEERERRFRTQWLKCQPETASKSLGLPHPPFGALRRNFGFFAQRGLEPRVVRKDEGAICCAQALRRVQVGPPEGHPLHCVHQEPEAQAAPGDPPAPAPSPSPHQPASSQPPATTPKLHRDPTAPTKALTPPTLDSSSSLSVPCGCSPRRVGK